MARPAVTAFTERLYARLPAFYRAADAGLDWPLLRYLSLTGDLAGQVETLLDRIDYRRPSEGGEAGDTSDLVDVDTADAAWLPYNALLRGVLLLARMTVPEQRDAVRTAASGWRGGNGDAVIEAARTVLTGTRYAELVRHVGGNRWHLGVRTKSTETPDPQDVIDAVELHRAKPVGVRLVIVAYQATWGQLQAAHPTWATLNGLTWAQRQEV